MRSSRHLALFVLAGCKGCAEVDAPPTDLVEVSADAVGVYAGEGVGAGVANVPVYAVNAVGAAVLSTDLAVSEGTVVVDGLGWGTVAVESTGPVTASAAGVSTTGAGWVTAATPRSFELPGYGLADLVPPDHVAVAGGGVAWVGAGVTWWASASQPAVKVAVLADEVASLSAVQLDSDGVTDLLVYSARDVVLLRGRDGGGLVFAAGWSTDGTIVGCDVQDLDGDALADVQVAVSDGASTRVTWFLADGEGWTLSDWFTVDFVALGLSGEDYTGDGEVEFSLVSEDGLLERYARFDDGWVPASSSDLPLGFTAGAHLYPSTDLDDDGIAEIVIAGPLADGTGWQAEAVTAGAAQTMSYQFYSGSGASGLPLAIELAIGDLTGDGLADLAMASDLGLSRVAWDSGADPGFVSVTSAGYPTSRGIGSGNLDGDGVSDILLGADSYVLGVLGVREEDDPDTAMTESWGVKPSAFVAYDMAIAGTPVLDDLDGDDHADLLAFSQGAAGLQLDTWRSYPASGDSPEGWTLAGSTPVATTADPVDLAACSGVAWALYDEAGITRLRGYVLDGSGAAGALSVDIAVAGDQVLCGPFDDSAGSLVAVVDGDQVTGVAADGTASSQSSPGAMVTSADTDGDGLRELVGATGAGQLLAADFDGDGDEEAVSALDDAVGLEALRPSFGGALSLQDADGDGLPDVVLAGGGTVWVYRVLDGALTPPVVFHTNRPVQGAALFADISGDGAPDLLTLGSDEDPDWAGKLLYANP